MHSDVLAYYNECVLDVFLDARKVLKDESAGRSKDLKAAITSATALFHYRERVPKFIRILRAEAELRCADYGVVADVVNAAKHGELTRPTAHGVPYITNASQIEEQVWIIEYNDSEGTYRHSEKVVALKLSDGTERDLLEVITNVINFWEKFNSSVGISSDMPREFKYARPGRSRSRAECRETGITLEMVAGRRFTQNWRLLRFNSATAQLEPVDLSGRGLRMNLYRPAIAVDLFLDDHVLGKAYTETIEIFDEEAKTVTGLEGDEERMKYVMTLGVAQQAMERMAQLSMQERSEGPKDAED